MMKMNGNVITWRWQIKETTLNDYNYDLVSLTSISETNDRNQVRKIAHRGAIKIFATI